MAVKLKEIRYKHQRQALEIKGLPPDERENAFITLAFSLVESWDYRGENGEILPINGVATFEELRIVDLDELSRALNEALFPKNQGVKKTSVEPLPSGSMQPNQKGKRK